MMKQSICPTCYWYHETKDGFFGSHKVCEDCNAILDNVTITQCQSFKEREE